MCVARLRVLQARAHPELVVIAYDLVPGDLRIEAGGVEGPLVIDGRGTQVGARTGSDDLPVDGVDEPAQFVVLRVVAASPSDRPKSNGVTACSALMVCTAASSTCGVDKMIGE